MRISVMAALLAAVSAGGIACADVGIEIQFDGYDEAAKQCEFNFAYTDFGAGFSKIDFAYEVFVKGEKVSICTDFVSDEFTDTSCRGMPEAQNTEYTCDDISKVRPAAMRCFDGNGAEAACGPMKIRGSDRFTFD